ncbi:hypothetical protein [Carnobacterium sp. FSL E2-0243]|uniref:hypothetical protein n=1 Tax=Carnobacterium sp. FSL E2-0243 TaxID=2921365 RepID=UPI0030FA24B4
MKKTVSDLINTKNSNHEIFDNGYKWFFSHLENELLKSRDVTSLIQDYNDEAVAFIYLQLKEMERKDIEDLASDDFPKVVNQLTETVKEKYSNEIESAPFFITERAKMMMKQNKR